MKNKQKKAYKKRKQYKTNLVSLLSSSKSNHRFTTGAFGRAVK